jgi:hypothetical protein
MQAMVYHSIVSDMIIACTRDVEQATDMELYLGTWIRVSNSQAKPSCGP